MRYFTPSTLAFVLLAVSLQASSAPIIRRGLHKGGDNYRNAMEPRGSPGNDKLYVRPPPERRDVNDALDARDVYDELAAKMDEIQGKRPHPYHEGPSDPGSELSGRDSDVLEARGFVDDATNA
ncbi:hypothetical protein BDP27DRAFT_1416619 [Rhodocollybia butyracea]|uniref:Uncharacterized protein n=1 Tax=Rhodocollybia butyracea TaxID=206335 RepID=A0A9P5UCA4_9AGAR|nr:hypothetical protein BDP27DRAFT_1416619 [Rhodocollybia butyracea]